MGTRERSCNRQSQAGAASLSIARFLKPVEWAKRLFPKRFRNARAMIIDVNEDRTRANLHTHIGTPPVF